MFIPKLQSTNPVISNIQNSQSTSQGESVDQVSKIFSRALSAPIDVQTTESLGLDEAEIGTWSRLENKGYPSLGNTSAEQAQLFAHIWGDQFIKGTSLEGYCISATAHYMQSLCTYLSEGKGRTSLEKECPKELQDLQMSLRQIIDFSQAIAEGFKSKKNANTASLLRAFALKYAQKIFQLKPEEHYSLPGGWAGKPSGHTMIYTFVKNSDDTFDIFISNTGAGTELAHNAQIEKNKSKICPIVHFSRVSIGKLFFCENFQDIQPIRFQKIIECLIATQLDENIDIKAEEIYGSIFGDLKAAYKSIDHSIIGMMSGQQSGICSFKALLPHAYRLLTKNKYFYMDKKSVYKKFKYELAFASLISYYQGVKSFLHEDTSKASQARNLLGEAARKFLRNATKIYLPSSVDFVLNENEARVAYATAKDLLNQLANHEKNARSAHLQLGIPIKIQPIQEDSEVAIKRRTSLREIADSLYIPWKGSISIESTPYQPVLRPQPENFLRFIERLKTIIQENDDVFIKKMQIEKSIFLLPMPIDKNITQFWHKIPEKDLSLSLKLMDDLLARYATLSLHPLSSFPHELDTMCAMYAMIHSLALRVDASRNEQTEPRLSDYGVSFPRNSLLKDPQTVYFNPSLFERRKEIVTYFSEQPSLVLFDVKNCLEIDDTPFGINTIDCCFYEALIDGNQTLREALNDPANKTEVDSKDYKHLKEKTRQIAKLIADDGHSSPELLKKAGMEHLLPLKRAAIIIQLAGGYSKDIPRFSGTQKLPDSTVIIGIKPPGFIKSKIEFFYKFGSSLTLERDRRYLSVPRSYITYVQPLSATHRSLSKRSMLFLNSFEGNQRLISNISWPSEGGVLSHTKSNTENSHPLEPLFKRSDCEPRLQLYTILAYFIQNPEFLEESDTQTLFEIFFFRHISDCAINKTFLHHHLLFEQLSSETNLLSQIAHLVEVGLKKFYSQRPEKRPDVYTSLFFLRLSLRVKYVLQTSRSHQGNLEVLPQEKSYILKWLEIEDLKPSEKSTLHLHLIACYSLSPSTPIDDEALKIIIPSWLYFCQDPIDETWKDLALEHQVKEWIHENHLTFKQLLAGDLKDDVFKKGLTQFHLENDFAKSWTGKHPVYQLSTNGNDWKINLLTGAIANSSGLVKSGSLPDYKTAFDFKQLFGDQDFNMRQNGGMYYFFSPLYGPMRLCMTYPGAYCIQRQEKDGSWFQYLNPNSIHVECYFANLKLPFALVNNHTHWMPLDRKTGNTISRKEGKTDSPAMEIRKKDTGTLVAKIVFKQEFQSNLAKYPLIDLFDIGKNTLSQKTTSIGTVVTARDPRSREQMTHLNHLLRIDQKSSILIWNDLDNNQHISFSRYKSLHQNRLEFILSSNEEKLRWTENVNLHLAPAQNFLPKISYNCLALANHEEKITKVLIPCQLPLTPNDFSSFCCLDIRRNNPLRSNPVVPKQTLKEMESDYYLEYDLKGEDLVPQNTEGRLLLSLIFLAQKNPEKALEHILQIAQTDEISTLSLRIIHWIICSKELFEQTPQGSAIRLHTFLLLKNVNHRPDYRHAKEDTLTPDMEREMLAHYERYLENLNHVSPLLKLSIEQELFLCSEENFRQSKHVQNRRVFLTTNTYPEAKKTSITTGFDSNAFPWRNTSKSSLLIGSETKDAQLSFCQTDPKVPFSLINPSPQDFLLNFGYLYSLATTSSKASKDYITFILSNLKAENAVISTLCSILQYAVRSLKNEHPLPPDEATNEIKNQWLQNALILNTPATPIYGRKELDAVTFNPFQLNITKTSSIQEIEEQPFLLQLPRLSCSQIQLAQKYLKEEKPLIESNNSIHPFKKQIFLEKNEKCFEKAVVKDCEEFCIDYQKGLEDNLSKKNFSFACENSANNLKKDLELEIQTSEDISKKILKEILQLANRRPLDVRHSMLFEGKVERRIDLSDLIKAFLKKKRTGFYALNIYLTKQETGILYQKVGEYLFLGTQLQQMKRSLKIIDQITHLKKGEDLARFYLLQQLGETLNAPCTYDPSKDTDCLVFEYQSNMRIRRKQFQLIQKMSQGERYTNLVIQLGMGEGKTSVIASLLGYMAAINSNRLSLFIVPSPLFETVIGNIKKSQRENFYQEINAIDFVRKHFTLKNLTWLHNQLKLAINKQQMVLMKGEMIQSLGLEYIHMIRNYSQSPSTKEEDVVNKIEKLRAILNILSTQTDALGDEVDQLLNVLKAVNFPEGEEEKIGVERADLIREIYTLLSSDQLLLEGRPLSKVVGLRGNKQTLLSEEMFHDHVKPLIARELSQKHLSLQLPEEHRSSFIRYITKEIDPKLQSLITAKNIPMLSKQESNDLAFLKFLRELSESKEDEKKESAHLIALARHLLNQIIPSTLGKNGNRHYGRIKKGTKGKVVPYLGVDTPATTLFGNHYEAACFHMQTALLEGITKNQIFELADALKKSAEFFSQIEQKSIDETPEAKEFKKLTSVDLHQIQLPGKIEEAIQYVNKKVSRILKFETETILSTVLFHKYKLNSTPQTLIDHIDTFRAFSGTPWNSETYPETLSRNTNLDPGTEGKIAHIMIERERANPNIIHRVTSSQPSQMLASILDNHPRRKRVKGLIDTGALLKGINNLDAAKGILDYFKHDASIQAVSFYHKRPESETPDTPAILKKGSQEPILLKSTHHEEIASKGIPLSEIFFYYDDRHTTGTDFVQMPDAINLLTIDEGILRRTLFQGALRLRQFLFSQDLEYVILEEATNSFVDGGQSIENLILTGIKNQAIRKSKDTFRAYLQKIQSAVKKHAFKELLDPQKQVPDLPKIFNEYEKALVDEIGDTPYAQFGELETDIPSLEALTNRATSYKNIYRKAKLSQDIDAIIEDAKRSPYLPTTVQNSVENNSSAEGEIELQTETLQEVELQAEVRLEMDLLKELENYECTPFDKPYEEVPWDYLRAMKFIQGIEDLKDPLLKTIRPLSLILANQKKEYTINYRRPYHKIFDPNIFATDNFRLTDVNPQSVFHSIQKPAHQILIVLEKGNYRAYLLSLKEAAFFKEFLQGSYIKKENIVEHFWLCGPNGDLLAHHPRYHVLPDEDPVKKILFQVNLFNGNAQYFVENQADASTWFNESHTDLKISFMKLKIEKLPKQKKIFHQSEIFNTSNKKSDTSHLTIFKARRCEKASLQKKALKLTDLEIPSADSKLIPYLPLEKVPLLKDPQHIRLLSPTQIPCVNLYSIQHLTSKQLRHLNKAEQFNNLSENQFSFIHADQLRSLSDQELQGITKEKLIQKIPMDAIPKLAKNQLKHLSPAQIATIQDDTILQQLDKQQVNHLTSSQLKMLITPELIQAVPIGRCTELRDEQLCHLSNEQVFEITETRFLQRLPEDQIHELENTLHQPILVNEDRTRIQGLIQRLAPHQIEWLKIKTLPYLRNDQLKFLNKKEHIQSLTADKIWYVNHHSRQHMGFFANTRPLVYGITMALAAVISIPATIFAVATGLFFLRNRLSFCGKIWSWITHPFNQLSYVWHWLQSSVPN